MGHVAYGQYMHMASTQDPRHRGIWLLHEVRTLGWSKILLHMQPHHNLLTFWMWSPYLPPFYAFMLLFLFLFWWGKPLTWGPFIYRFKNSKVTTMGNNKVTSITTTTSSVVYRFIHYMLWHKINNDMVEYNMEMLTIGPCIQLRI